MDKFLSIWESKCRAEFCNVPEVKEGGFAQMFNMGVISQMGIHSNTEVCD